VNRGTAHRGNFLQEDLWRSKSPLADGIELYGVDGSKFDLTGKPGISLCRCGGSVNKPFCDGTHSKIGFVGAESAVKKAENPT
jgi:CDGSH-type Zn-finger protein